LLALNCLADLGICGVNLRRILRDGDGLTRIQDMQNDIQRQRGVDVNLQICCLTVRVEAICCHVEFVLPYGYNGEVEYPLVIAGRSLSYSSCCVEQTYTATWDDSAGFILHRSGDPAAPSLSECGMTHEKD
jgi:hypothetical protein